MRKSRKAAWFLVPCILSVLLTGCWDYTDVEDLAVAMGMSVDKSGDGFRVTAEIAHPGKNGSIESFLIEGEGKTIFDCQRNLVKKVENKVYWPHAQIVILSEEIAKEGISQVLDMMARSRQLRMSLHVLVSREPTARRILESDSILTDLRSVELESILMNNQQNLSKAPATELYQVIDAINGEGRCAALPAVKTVVNAGKASEEVDGTAVLEKDRLVGYLDGDETKAYLFATGQAKGGLLLVQDPEVMLKSGLSLEITDSKTAITPLYRDGALSVQIDIKADTVLGENESGKDYDEDELEQMAEATLQRDVQNVVEKVQKEFNADIFGFGAAVERDMPEIWDQAGPAWSIRGFRTLPVLVRADVTVENMGLIKKPVKAGG